MEQPDTVRRLAEQLRAAARAALDERAHLSILKKLVGALGTLDKLRDDADPEELGVARARAQTALADWGTWRSRGPKGPEQG